VGDRHGLAPEVLLGRNRVGLGVSDWQEMVVGLGRVVPLPAVVAQVGAWGRAQPDRRIVCLDVLAGDEPQVIRQLGKHLITPCRGAAELSVRPLAAVRGMDARVAVASGSHVALGLA
jgi:hypothetical protein